MDDFILLYGNIERIILLKKVVCLVNPEVCFNNLEIIRHAACAIAILGAKNITLHPNNINREDEAQKEALKNLEYFTGMYKDDIVFCIETFEGRRRVFTPDETVAFNLPMTLDISHIRDNEKIWNLLKGYKDKILNVHLSAREGSNQHLPIDDFCKEVVSYLVETKWEGNVILEYLFEFHDQMLSDLKILKAME